LADELGDATPDVQAILIDVLAARGDEIAKPTILAALGGVNQDVRIAALRALKVFGDESDVVRLAEAAANASGGERDASRASLNRLRGEDVDAAILAEAQGTHQSSVRAELIRSIPQRHVADAQPVLLATAQDEQEPVRVAAFEALGELAAESDLADLVNLLIEERGSDARNAAEDAVVATCLHSDDVAGRAEPILTAFPEAKEQVKASLLRVLGRVRGSQALEVIRRAVESPVPEVVDAAVRALAKWDNADVLDDLLRLARQSSTQTHQVLALRGYVRLTRLPSDRDPADTFKMLEGAMSLSEQDAEKKLVLSALTDVKLVAALDKARSYIGTEALRDEAAVATLALAKSLVATDIDEALAAIDEVRAAAIGAGAQKTLKETVAFIERHDGYIGTWLFAGPYKRDGKDANAVFNIAFGPETPDAHEVAWRPIAGARPDNPFVFDFDRFARESNCCAYVKALVRSPKEQPAKLEIGSDDAVKVWLNDELVHSKLVFRGINAAADKVDVTLKEGWNTLMLKIVQGSGGWGFTCGVKSPDGGALAGLEFKAE
jgi:HEAT repeat protein